MLNCERYIVSFWRHKSDAIVLRQTVQQAVTDSGSAYDAQIDAQHVHRHHYWWSHHESWSKAMCNSEKFLRPCARHTW